MIIKIRLSDTNLFKDILEINFFPLCKSSEDQEDVTISVESS